MPYGYADVRGVETWLHRGEGNDVAIVYCPSHESCVCWGAFGDVAVLVAGKSSLHVGNLADPFGMAYEHGILVDMATHIINAKRLDCSKWRVGCLSFTDVPFYCVVVNPFREVV